MTGETGETGREAGHGRLERRLSLPPLSPPLPLPPRPSRLSLASLKAIRSIFIWKLNLFFFFHNLIISPTGSETIHGVPNGELKFHGYQTPCIPLAALSLAGEVNVCRDADRCVQ